MQQTTFPLTLLLKQGKLRVISTLTPTLTMPLIQRVIQELETPYQNRHYEPEGEKEDGEPNPIFQTFQNINADAICLLTGDGEFIFILSPIYEIHETINYQHLMREKLMQYTH